MKQVSAFAFNRPDDAWLYITSDERRRLRGLEAWTFLLFAELVCFSDFKTGHGRTGYGELIARLSPDQPPSGPRLWAPSRDDVKKALRRFEDLDLVAVDRIASEKRKALFFHVLPRTRTATPARKLPPELTPTSTEGEHGELTPRTTPGDSENNSLKTARAKSPVDNSRPTTAPPGLKARVRKAIADAGHPLN